MAFFTRGDVKRGGKVVDKDLLLRVRCCDCSLP